MTRLVWITMLALADASGFVEASVPGLAHAAVVPLDACRVALDKLASPDLDSKDPDHEGRRIEKVDGGWQLLNYNKYREMRTPKQITDAARQRRKYAKDHESDVREVTGDTVRERDTSRTSRDTSQTSREVSASSSASSSSVEEMTLASDKSASVISSEEVIREKGQLALVPIAPPAREDAARKAALRFLAARHMRLHGWRPGQAPKEPSKGMVASITARMMALLRQGFEAQLLVSLPALVAEEATDFMLRKDPEVLLRTDNAQGGKCHARRYEGQLAGMTLNAKQVAILRNIGTAEYVQACGAKGEW